MSNAFVIIKMCYGYNQWYDISCATLYYFQPLKMELIHGSKTSAYHILTPGKYPKEHIQHSVYTSCGHRGTNTKIYCQGTVCWRCILAAVRNVKLGVTKVGN